MQLVTVNYNSVSYPLLYPAGCGWFLKTGSQKESSLSSSFPIWRMKKVWCINQYSLSDECASGDGLIFAKILLPLSVSLDPSSCVKASIKKMLPGWSPQNSCQWRWQCEGILGKILRFLIEYTAFFIPVLLWRKQLLHSHGRNFFQTWKMMTSRLPLVKTYVKVSSTEMLISVNGWSSFWSVAEE